MSLTTGKIAEVLLDQTVETFEHQMQMLPLTSFKQPDAGTMQNAGNVIWRPVPQHAPVIDGWDVTGLEGDIIEETYPAVLGVPKNDFVRLRADDMRDMGYWNRRAVESGRQQATELNKLLAKAIAVQGSLFYRSNATSGYDFIGEAQALMNERQLKDTGRTFMLNDRDNLTFASDLANRQTLQGRPADTWSKGQIGENVAGFDVYTGSFLPNIAGGASPDATVTGAQTFAPTAGSVNTTTGVVTNVDWRTADIPVSDSSGYNVGDKVTIGAVQSVGLADKAGTGQLMTFTVIAKPDATTLTVYPKPIAAVDPALSNSEMAYANTDVVIPNAAVVARLNIDASAKTNLFWDKDAVEVLGGTIPAHLFKDYAGFKVVSTTMSNGLEMYVMYDGDIATATFRYRLFCWYGITVWNPQNAGVAVSQ